MSPLGQTIVDLHKSMCADNEAKGFFTNEQRIHIIESVFDAYYEKHLDKTIFDTSRRWCAHIPMLKQVFPDCRVICCVRPPAHIVDSMERLLRAHPMELSATIAYVPNTTVYSRVKLLMASEGLVGYAYNALRDAYFGPDRDRLILIEYAKLATEPEHTLRNLHQALGLEWFAYDFNAILSIPGAVEFDKSIGTVGLHDLKPRVVYEPKNSILPPDIYKSLPPAFWRNTPVTNTQ